MSGLAETDDYPDEIYQIEQTDPVVGGAPNEATGAGMSNIPHQQLAKRTRWLKNRVDALVAAVVSATTSVAGIVQLSSSVASTSTTQAATPSAVKAAYDLAASCASKATSINTGGLATGGGTLAADRTITVTAATQVQAEAGTDTTTAMTPLRTAQAIAALAPSGMPGGVILDNPAAAGGATALVVSTWTTTPLTTLALNELSLSLSGNVLTVPAGTYYAEFSLPVRVTASSTIQNVTARLRDVTAGVTRLVGQSSKLGDWQAYQLQGAGVFTIGASADLELQVWSSSTQVEYRSDGTNTNGEPPVFAIVKLWKIG